MEKHQPVTPVEVTDVDPGQNLVRQRVRQFYDEVGWQVEVDGNYQNARYEDLRPVSRDYIHRCHMRVNRHLSLKGQYLLDAGSGPVQYAEYLTYSQHYHYRVCVDLSITALSEARRRLGEHALCVVADVSHLPFAAGVFEGAVSLHTFHHLPLTDQPAAYAEIYRTLSPGSTAVIVNGWTDSLLMRRMRGVIWLAERIGQLVLRLRGKLAAKKQQENSVRVSKPAPTGTYVQKLDAAWLKSHLGGKISYTIYPWRSVSVRFLRAIVHQATGGALFLRILFALEERFPQYFAEYGQYPMIVVQK